MRKLWRLIAGIANAPWSLLHLLFIIAFCQPRAFAWRGGALVVIVGRMSPLPGTYSGVTLGSVIRIHAPRRNHALLLRHEMVHMRQQERIPLLWPLVYLAEYAWQLFLHYPLARHIGLREWHRMSYFANRFEEEARRKSAA